MSHTFQVSIDRIAHDGAGEGMHEGAPIRVFGMYPGESGIVEAHKKRGIWFGTLKEIFIASPARKLPDESHHLACSPWQSAEYASQLEWKRGILEDSFSYYQNAPKVSIVSADRFFGYRTKIEFSFSDRDHLGNSSPLSLAFHERGGGSRRLPLPEGCLLGSTQMNRVAESVLVKLRDAGYSARDLKTLVVRESKSNGNVIAILYVKRDELQRFSTDDIERLSGIIVFHSTEKSPASVPTRELWRSGEGFLDESILGMNIRYSWDSFFQNNVPMFELALRSMQNAIPEEGKVLELYSGVGAIGLGLAHRSLKVHGIEIVPSAVDFAKANAKHNDIQNYVSECIPAEKVDARLLDGISTLIVDPPRSGLHSTVIEMIKEKLPPMIVYLSCNPETQARDYSMLKDLYRIESVEGFDFYPQTPHVESLLVLSRIS
jgi:23S rRNA (uracil1939-C5)-methyltransferase